MVAAKNKTPPAPGGKEFYSPEADKTADSAAKPPAKRKAAAAKPPAKAQTARSALTPIDETLPIQKGAETTADLTLGRLDERDALTADIARIRAQRKPFGAFTQKLAYPARPGYHRHWFSDEPGRVDEAVSNGWAHVNDKEDKPVKRVVGRGRDGGAMYGFLMELPKVFWDEDMAAKHDAAQARIDEIKKNPFRAKPGQADKSDQGKFYSAKDEPVRMTQTMVRSAPGT